MFKGVLCWVEGRRQMSVTMLAAGSWEGRMKGTMTGGHRLALVSIIAVLTLLGSVPAFADEGPLVTVPTTTADAVDAATSTIDEVSDAVTATVDETSDAVTTTVDQLSGAAAPVVDVVDTESAATVDAVTDAGTGDAESNTGWVTVGSSVRAGGSSSGAGTSFDSTQGASPLRSGGERTVLTPADGAERPRWAVHDTAPCPDAGGGPCSPTSGTSEEDSLAEKISEVIGKLAVTGSLLLPWIAAALALTALGSVALERSRGTGSQARRVTAA
jgi:hypothetical protein